VNYDEAPVGTFAYLRPIKDANTAPTSIWQVVRVERNPSVDYTNLWRHIVCVAGPDKGAEKTALSGALRPISPLLVIALAADGKL